MEEKLPVRPKLVEMEVGEEATFPLERCNTVAKTASELSLIMERTYTTRRDRSNRIIVVKRIA